MPLEQTTQVRRDQASTKLHRDADAQTALRFGATIGDNGIGFVDRVENRHGFFEIGLAGNGYAGVACGAIEQARAQLVFQPCHLPCH